MENKVDVSQLLRIFDPVRFGDMRIDIIGCGAVGSKVAIEIAKLGIRNLHLWDFDTIEAKNVQNQFFRIEDVGKKKVEALAELVEIFTGLTPTIHDERVDGSQELGEVVFLLTDTFASRREIFEKALENSFITLVVIETRMGVDFGYIHLINPTQREECNRWKEALGEDPVVPQESACGSKDAVGATSSEIAAKATEFFISWFSWYLDDTKYRRPPQELMNAWRPLFTQRTDLDN